LAYVIRENSFPARDTKPPELARQRTATGGSSKPTLLAKPALLTKPACLAKSTSSTERATAKGIPSKGAAAKAAKVAKVA
jgi:hypothetical protein